MVMDRVSHKTKIDVFENAFRKIKEVSSGAQLGPLERRRVRNHITGGLLRPGPPLVPLFWSIARFFLPIRDSDEQSIAPWVLTTTEFASRSVDQYERNPSCLEVVNTVNAVAPVVLGKEQRS